jgi:hypothetical protein
MFTGSRRRRWTLALGAAVLAAAAVTAGIVLLAGGSASESRPIATVAQHVQEPLLVPRRRRPPTVVEPDAGGGTVVDPAEAAAAARPATPLPDTGPSPGAPTDAELKTELGQLRTAQARYNLNGLDFSGSLINPADLTPGVWRTSIASVYTDYFQGIACGGTLKPAQLGVAHKTLPCGTMVTFRYGNRAIRVPVIDRGPYIAGREWDFTGATATALGFPGLGQVQWRIG